MLWRDLPDEAKNILEWLESPVTGQLITISITRNELYEYAVVKVFVECSLYDKIKAYCTGSRDIDCTEEEQTLTVRLKKRARMG